MSLAGGGAHSPESLVNTLQPPPPHSETHLKCRNPAGRWMKRPSGGVRWGLWGTVSCSGTTRDTSPGPHRPRLSLGQPSCFTCTVEYGVLTSSVVERPQLAIRDSVSGGPSAPAPLRLAGTRLACCFHIFTPSLQFLTLFFLSRTGLEITIPKVSAPPSPPHGRRWLEWNNPGWDHVIPASSAI